MRDPTGLLLRVLPAVAYHSDWMRKEPGHPFGMIPFLQRRGLLNDMKQLVTTQPIESMKVTGAFP